MEASCFSAAAPSTGSTSSESIIKASIAIFKGHLLQRRQRAPRGSETALAKAYALEETTTERIFLDHGGKEAWLAFYCARQHPTIASFRQASAADKIDVAREVHNSVKDPSVADIIDKLSRRRPRK